MIFIVLFSAFRTTRRHIGNEMGKLEYSKVRTSFTFNFTVESYILLLILGKLLG